MAEEIKFKTQEDWLKMITGEGGVREYIIRETSLPLATKQEVVGEIVRCKDCKWYKPSFMWNGKEVKICCVEEHQPLRNEDFFCAYGERKEN